MLSYLAFDSRSIRSLLCDNNKDYFNEKFPLFFKNEEGETAIDIALKYNQIKSVDIMVNYIVTYQEKYVFSHLFERNLVDLIEKGCDVDKLFNSKIFNYPFDFDEWPTTSSET